MAQTAVSTTDLSAIKGAISTIGKSVQHMDAELGQISIKQNKFEGEMTQLSKAFAQFVDADLRHKSLQLAETRVGNIRQELQIKFGYHSEIRRMATGILQSVDIGIISDDTLQYATEEVCIKAPGYWLPTALVTLASWIRNDKNASEKALAESLKRNDYKTTLFFMLVMRRLGRYDASLQWLERYFLHQNPQQLDREFIIILEAVTTGIFHPASKQLMVQHIKNWLAQMSQTDQFIQTQKTKWIQFFAASAPFVANTYPLLKTHSATFNGLEQSLRSAKTHQIIYQNFSQIFAVAPDFSKSVKVQLDEILTLLVTNFDEEELPLQQQVQLNQLIVQYNGDVNAAQSMMDAQQHIYDKKVDFLQLLTNASFDPESAGASKATQALAVSIGLPWITEAYDTFTAQCRSLIPLQITLNVDEFITRTSNGSDEVEQIAGIQLYYQKIEEKEVAQLQFPIEWAVVGGLVSLAGILGCFYLPIIAVWLIVCGGVLIGMAYYKHNKAKNNIKAEIIERSNRGKAVLKGCLAELVDYKKELQKEDTIAEKARQLLLTTTVNEYISGSIAAGRSIL